MIARHALLAVALLGGAPLPQPDDEGARLSVDVREGDLRRILAALAEVGGFQLVVDADVACRLTLKVERLAWPDVLGHVLRACGMGHEADGNVVRVAPLSRLASEASQRRALSELRGESDRAWRLQRLSYARAEELAPVLQRILGEGAEVVYDRRTNTLILIEGR